MIAYATSRAYYISYVLYFLYITYTEPYVGKDFKYFSEKTMLFTQGNISTLIKKNQTSL